MDRYILKEGALTAEATTECGALLSLYYHDLPVLRPYCGGDEAKLIPTTAASFPMVPFCNRVEGNGFSYGGREYTLKSNTDWDPLYLHGEGWISRWELKEANGVSVRMGLTHRAEEGAPYDYEAEQIISVEGETLSLRISLTNLSDFPMPFGTGHHLFFPKTDATRLKAGAEGYWTEKELYLPDKRVAIPADLDFSVPAPVPDRWINNGFDRWDGTGEITWPERELAVVIEGDRYFGDYFVFNSDRTFEPDFQNDYFCFEPMTHSADGHHYPPDYAGLVRLERGERLDTVVILTPRPLRR